MDGVNYTNFMTRFRSLQEDIERLVEQQDEIIELLKGIHACLPIATDGAGSKIKVSQGEPRFIDRGEYEDF